jgi:hypothetical protein
LREAVFILSSFVIRVYRERIKAVSLCDDDDDDDDESFVRTDARPSSGLSLFLAYFYNLSPHPIMSEIDFACDGERSKNRLRAAKSDTEHTLERTERPQFSYSKYLYARIALFQFKRNIGRPRRAR